MKLGIKRASLSISKSPFSFGHKGDNLKRSLVGRRRSYPENSLLHFPGSARRCNRMVCSQNDVVHLCRSTSYACVGRAARRGRRSRVGCSPCTSQQPAGDAEENCELWDVCLSRTCPTTCLKTANNTFLFRDKTYSFDPFFFSHFTLILVCLVFSL